MTDDQQVSPLMQELSSYIAGALKRKLPAEITEHAKLNLLDTFGAMISGSRLIAGKSVIAYVKPLSGLREAGVMGTRFATSALYAALANGMCGHADETDVTHPPSRTHPGTTVIPAVLAIAERQRLSGEQILRALVLGYDINARVTLCLGQMNLKKAGHRGTAIGGLFGAGAAAGALLKLEAGKIGHMLSYCAQQAAGLYTSVGEEEHVEKAFQCGMAAHNGVAAALMVKSGFTGVADILSGKQNFLSIYSPNADRDALVRGLGREYEVVRTGMKYWPAGGPIQGPLHVLHDLIGQHGIKADDVEKLVARMPDVELDIVDGRAMPDISVQHLLALMLVDGTVTFKSAHDFKRTKDPRVRKLRSRIETVGDPSLTDDLRRWRCVMEITLKDGRRLNHQTMAAKGMYDNPLTRKELEEKASDLLVPILGKTRSMDLMSAVFNIESIKDARALRKLYAA